MKTAGTIMGAGAAALFCALLASSQDAAPAQDQNRPSGERRFCIYGARPTQSEKLAIRVAKALTMTGGPIDQATILVSGGRIEAIGPSADIAVPEGYRLIEHPDGWATPGLVELHCHVGGTDWNDMVYQVNPELRNLDAIVPDNDNLKVALAGGVTTALFLPGSGTNMGGFGTLIKTHGKTLGDVLVRFPGALKIAQAGNPERGADLGAGRMGMNWTIREVLDEGRQYHQRWVEFESGRTKIKPERNLRLEMFRGLFAREFPVAVHTQIFQVVQSTMRILHDEMGLWTVTDHSTFDGYKNAPEFVKRGIWTICGPRGYHFDRETSAFRGIAATWWEGGVRKIGLNTDSPVIPQEDLIFQATMAAWFGLPPEAALRAVTLVPAQAMGIDDRVGSLEAGKDADIVVWTGDPLDVRTWVKLTLVNGAIAYDPARDGRRY